MMKILQLFDYVVNECMNTLFETKQKLNSKLQFEKYVVDLLQKIIDI